MNKLIPIVLSLTLFVSLISCKENNISAKQYHDEVYASVDTVVKYIFLLDNDLRSKSSNVDKSYETLNKLTTHNIEFITEKGSFEQKDDKMQMASLNILNYYKTYIDKDFKQALEIVKKDSMTENDENQVLEIINQFYDGESKYLDVFKKESYDFGDRYKIYKAKTGNKN